MSLFDLADINALDKASLPMGQDALLPWINARKPVLFEDIFKNFPEMRNWKYQWIKKRLKSIRVQRPSEDGIYHYLGFERISIDEFDKTLKSGNNAYALEPLKGQGVKQEFPTDFKVELQNLLMKPNLERPTSMWDQEETPLYSIMTRPTVY